MKKINMIRLNVTITKCESCINELDEFYNEIISGKYEDNKIIKRSMELSFRSLFNSFQSIVEDYVAIVLKTLSIDVSRLYFRQCLDLCVENNFISKKFLDGFKPSIKLRNDIAHGYDIPSTEILLDYYKNNKEVYSEFLNNINDFKNSLNSNDIF